MKLPDFNLMKSLVTWKDGNGERGTPTANHYLYTLKIKVITLIYERENKDHHYYFYDLICIRIALLNQKFFLLIFFYWKGNVYIPKKDY